jgi:hypothetical protein
MPAGPQLAGVTRVTGTRVADGETQAAEMEGAAGTAETAAGTAASKP